ncbi:MAG: beta-galactosidase [Polyangiaceae bacterium]|nr:beta-galactosidase [Polyangiaceae bacterium]
MSSTERAQRPRLVPAGLALGDRVVPLFAGAVRYYELEPEDWRAALARVKELGFRLVDVSIPWGVHEVGPGVMDLGEHAARLDVAGFLRTAHALGLLAIVRPGPIVGAELTWLGLPERIVWDAACQARSPSGRPVVLPALPLPFPAPSRASEAFHAEVRQWFSAVGAALAPLRWPDGPIVLAHLDSGADALARDGVYDGDHHPDAIAAYRRFLEEKYRRVDELRRAYDAPDATFAQLEPPRRLTARVASELGPHLDWAEFQEHLRASTLGRLREALARSGLEGVPTSCDLPMSGAATSLDAPRLARVVELPGLDYRHRASPRARAELFRRTTALATLAATRGVPAYAAELGAGCSPFEPPRDERDDAFTALAALAYGLRGFSTRLLVEQSRWIGAPIERGGRARPPAAFWKQLIAALERVRFVELTRRAEVRVVVPRSLRRLERVLHALGPLPAGLVHAAGGGVSVRALEEDLALGGPVLIETDAFLGALEQALERRRIPYAFTDGALLERALEEAAWVIVPCAGALEPELFDRIATALGRGDAVSVGPHPPTRDGAMRAASEPRALPASADAGLPALLDDAPDALERVVERAARTLGLRSLEAEPPEVSVTVHHDAGGRPAVLFVLNPSSRELAARVTCAGARSALDLLSNERFAAQGGFFSLSVSGRGARLLELTDHLV